MLNAAKIWKLFCWSDATDLEFCGLQKANAFNLERFDLGNFNLPIQHKKSFSICNL